MSAPSSAQPILSPCTGVCTLGGDGYCVGCLRSAAEIGGWLTMGEAARSRIMDEVLPRRERERGLA